MLRFLISALSLAVLVSCAGKTPPAETHVVHTNTIHHTTTVVRDTVMDTLTIKDSVIIRETENFRSLQKSIDSLVAKRETEKAIELLKKQAMYYSNLDLLGFRTLQLANLLHQTGHSAEALAVLEGFAVYKPSINFWIDSANTFYDKILGNSRTGTTQPTQQIDPEKQEAISSLTAQIRNLKNANANPAIIANLADSLRSIAPGDSILTWLEKQMPSATESSDAFCEEQRKFAAENFASSRKNKAKSKALLTEAVEALDKCLAKTPSASMRKKIELNKEVISKELRIEN